MIDLTEQLLYAEPGDGPWRIFVYQANGLHRGGRWFRKGPMKYPDEEIPFLEAATRAGVAIAHGLEVRIVDGGDMLVLHALNGKIVHGREFWSRVAAQADRELKEKERLTSSSENG